MKIKVIKKNAKLFSPEEIKAFQDKYLGKKIEFTDKKGETHVGKCEFIGYNPFLPTWGFQVTVDRCPISHVDPQTIKFFETKKYI